MGEKYYKAGIAGLIMLALQLPAIAQEKTEEKDTALKVKAHLVHTEASLDLGKLFHTNYRLHIGANFRDYIIVPDGNYLSIQPIQDIT